jgi:xylulokinase
VDAVRAGIPDRLLEEEGVSAVDALVAGVDSSTQSCKVVIRDAQTGVLVRQGRAGHPEGTEVHPDAWWAALQEAVDRAGGLGDVAAVAVGAQQHGMVTLDDAGRVVRPALLWNDTRSAAAARDLIDELGGGERGRRAWAEAVGSVPVASFTVTKLRWLAEHEPASAARTAAVCLPHDWLTWRLGTDPTLEGIRTDRGDASGTGYWSPGTGSYRDDLLERALGHAAAVPRVLGPFTPAGTMAEGAVLGPGTGDNAAAALGLDTRPGDAVVSIGTSGVVCSVAEAPTADPAGAVAGFADATGRFLPLIATLNAARVLDAAAGMLRVDHEELSRLALSAPPGADGLVVVPYLEGERTPDRPESTGAVHGLRLVTATPAHLARAAVEGLLCGLADGLDALVASGARVDRIVLVGGGARSPAVQQIAPTVLGRPVVVPPPGEYVADGAARQAAWTLSGDADPPQWDRAGAQAYDGDVVRAVRDRYAEARDLTLARQRSVAGVTPPTKHEPASLTR